MPLSVETVFDINVGPGGPSKPFRQVSQKADILHADLQENEKRLFLRFFGDSPRKSMQTLAAAGAAAVGANCSIGSDSMLALAAEIKAGVRYPRSMVQPNAGMPETIKKGGASSILKTEDFFAENIRKIKALGVEIVGGCCGTTPALYREDKRSYLVLSGNSTFHSIFCVGSPKPNPRNIINIPPV